jgi:radical SAM protein with 4Fe4S-binding SPASM domain
MELRNKQIILETINICDAHCVICPREKFTQKPQAMDMGLFKKIIDDAAQYNLESIDTCGFGECFLDRTIFEKFAYIRHMLPKAKIYVSTTGFHMDKDKWESVINYIDILKLSIYGYTPETYEAFHRGKIKHEGVMENILGFLNYKNGHPYTIGLFVETELNQHEKDDWINMWEPKLDEVFVWKPHNWVNGREYRKVDQTRQTTCGRPHNGPMYVHADGTVSPCCWDIHKQIKLGDLKEQTIEEIYKGQPYKALRHAHEKGFFGNHICRDCDQTNYNPEVLLYANNPTRRVGQITSNQETIHV